ncbi:MAG: hypothetical protein K6F37_06115 [Lachnospiraceae bacterium]|nr:hypothetical protein [Lachnospiraceae bacterium]
MQVTVGKSKAADANAAVKEATAKITSPKGLLFQSSFEHIEEVSRLLSEKYPDVPLIGTGATSYIESDATDKILVVVGFGEGSTLKAGVLRHLSSTPLYDIMSLEKAVSDIHPGQSDTVCLEYCTNDEERLVTSMNVALEHTGVTIVGGTVFGTPAGKDSMVCVNGKLYKDACAWLVVKNNTGKIRTYSENIYAVPDNARTHVATKVDLQTKELITLDNRPAADVYADELGLSRSGIVDNVFQNPLGRIVGEDTYIISQYDVTPSGGLMNYKKVMENDTICFLELLDYREINDRTRSRIKSENNHISFIFSVNCIYRHLFFTNENYLGTLLSDMASLGNHVGVVGGGEQYKRQHVNQTLVCAVFE